MNLDQERLAGVLAVMLSFVERGDLPGVVTLSRSGVVHVEVFGSAAIGGKPVRRDSPLRISSMTEPITAVAALPRAQIVDGVRYGWTESFGTP